MQYITSKSGLKYAIQRLEVERDFKEQQLRDNFQKAYNSLKPVNLIKETLNEVVSSPLLIDNILNTTIGLATGFITKKIVIGSSGNNFRRLLGTVLQFGIINIAQRPQIIKTLGLSIFRNFIHKKK